MSDSPSAVRFSSMGMRLNPPAITSLMSAALEHPGMLSLAAGFTDTDTLPVGLIVEAAQTLASREGSPEFLQYGTNRGRPGLRRMLAERTAALDDLAPGTIDPDRTLIGNGSQQILYLAMQVLTDPGDIVLVERPTYFVFLEMLRGLGVEAIGLPAFDDGSLDLAACEALLKRLASSPSRERVRALYLMSYFGNPSGVSRTEEEKAAVAQMLERLGLRLPVLEDAAYRDLWSGCPWPARSVLAMDAFAAFPRLYLGTLTKPFATGLKVGYAHASDGNWFDRLCWLKGHHDFGTANFNQAMLEEVVAAGALDRHLETLRATYATKMNALDHVLRHGGLADLGWNWERPAGGLYLWLRAPDGCDTDVGQELWRRCMEEEVLYVPGGLCLAPPVDVRFVRLSFGVLGVEALAEAAERFCRAARHAVGRKE